MAGPGKLLFYNKVMDKTAMRRFISRLINHFGMVYTAHILDQFKTLGFQHATYEAVSLGIDDLLTTPSKQWLIEDTEHENYYEEKEFSNGRLNTVEKLRQLVQTWYTTSEFLKQEMTPSFKVTDPLNPVHMMCFSGARGSISQVHQLVGMRGLMSNPQGEIIDSPIRNNFREGLSVIEYIISCYGARKGVVDTAVRTADAGYLTRRLVEVVQHIVVRKKDCGTIQGILISPIRDEKKIETFVQPAGLIGRVLADNVYLDARCIATRNQDIGAELVDQLRAFQTEPIFIRSPLTCKSIFWICQLCFGWNPTHGNLVELGEAVGIIAGQSIGEPGTQLTLRTFHTGGVFTGTIAQNMRTPLTGIIEFDANLIYPTRTKFGYPAWACDNDLPITIKNKNEIFDFIIPSQSLILVQNNECVKSKQVIAEIPTTIFPLKDKIEKFIYSELDGEMHCGAMLIHNKPEFRQYLVNSVNLSVKTTCIWILSGQFYNLSGIRFLLYQDGDQINTQSPLTKKIKLLLDSSLEKDQTNSELFDSYSKKDEQIFDHLKFDHNHNIFENRNWKYSTFILHGFVTMERNGIGKRVSLSLRQNTDTYNEQDLNIEFVPEISKNEVSQNNEILAISDSNDPQYITKVSGIIRYGTIKVESIGKIKKIIEDEETEKVTKRHKIIEEGNFFLIPEEVHTIHRSLSSLLVRNNDIIQAGTQITSNIHSQVSGLIKVRELTKEQIEIRILPGNIIYPREIKNLSKLKNALVPPGIKLFGRFESNGWTYLEWIQPHKEKRERKDRKGRNERKGRKGMKGRKEMKGRKKIKERNERSERNERNERSERNERNERRPFALVRPAIEYKIPNESELSTTFFHRELLREQKTLKVRTIQYISYEDGEEVRTISNTSIQLVQTCLVLDWGKESFPKEVETSFIEMRTNKTFKYFLQLNLKKYPLNNRSDDNTAGSKSIFSNKVNYTNFFSNSENYLFSRHKGIIHSLDENQ